MLRAAATVAPLTWRLRPGAALVVLSYHRVLAADSPALWTEQPTMYVSPKTLDLHLSELKRRFELVHLDEWLRRAAEGKPLPPLACAITFDDGWRDNLEFALPVLREHGAPATIFLVSSYIDGGQNFWPNRLMRLMRMSFAEPGSVVYPRVLLPVVEPALTAARSRGELEADAVDRVVKSAKAAFEESVIRELVAAAEPNGACTAESSELLSAEEVARLGATGLVRFGCHTATHYRLGGQTSREDLEREIVHSRARLQEICGQSVDLFCYPNGETSPDAIDMVRRHYIGAVTTRKGWHSVSRDPHLIRRIGVHEDMSNSRDSFLSRVSALL